MEGFKDVFDVLFGKEIVPKGIDQGFVKHHMVTIPNGGCLLYDKSKTSIDQMFDYVAEFISQEGVGGYLFNA